MWIATVFTISEGEDGFQTSIFISTLQFCNTATITKATHCFLLKVRLHLSSGCRNWIFTLQDLAVKSPHHLLLSGRTWEANLWKLASSVSRGQQWRRRLNRFKPVRQSDTLLRPNQSCRSIRGTSHDWREETEKLQRLRIIAAGEKKLANLKMQWWTKAPRTAD